MLPCQTPHELQQAVYHVGNLSALFGNNGTWADLDMMDLGPLSSFRGTPAATLHATVWMLARSPLMYSGPLPITDAYTLRLMTDPTALRIHSTAGRLHTRYHSGNCSCRQTPSGCSPDAPASASPCVALWWAELPARGGTNGRAVGVLNIGGRSAAPHLGMADIGLLPAASVSIRDIYGDAEVPVMAGGTFSVHVPAVGAVLLSVE